jgi:hypothetical protein
VKQDLARLSSQSKEREKRKPSPHQQCGADPGRSRVPCEHATGGHCMGPVQRPGGPGGHAAQWPTLPQGHRRAVLINAGQAPQPTPGVVPAGAVIIPQAGEHTSACRTLHHITLHHITSHHVTSPCKAETRRRTFDTLRSGNVYPVLTETLCTCEAYGMRPTYKEKTAASEPAQARKTHSGWVSGGRASGGRQINTGTHRSCASRRVVPAYATFRSRCCCHPAPHTSPTGQ